MGRCSSSRPDPNARYHTMVLEPIKYDRIEGLINKYTCVFCGLTVVTKDKTAMVTGG